MPATELKSGSASARETSSPARSTYDSLLVLMGDQSRRPLDDPGHHRPRPAGNSIEEAESFDSKTVELLQARTLVSFTRRPAGRAAEE